MSEQKTDDGGVRSMSERELTAEERTELERLCAELVRERSSPPKCCVCGRDLVLGSSSHEGLKWACYEGGELEDGIRAKLEHVDRSTRWNPTDDKAAVRLATTLPALLRAARERDELRAAFEFQASQRVKDGAAYIARIEKAEGDADRLRAHLERDDPVMFRAMQADDEECAALRAQLGAANERVKALKDKLHEIATDPHCAYPEGPAVSHAERQYQIGVADGHRCAASKARAALAKLDPDGTGEGAAT